MPPAAAKKPAAKKPAAKKPAARKPAGKQPAAKKPAARKTTAKKPAARATAAPKRVASRADLGKPIDGFFKRQSAKIQPIARALRALIEEAVPEARSSLKWGMPFFMLGDEMVCAIGAHKAHVNLILSGPPSAFPDPDGRLSGEGKTGRHLKLTPGQDVPAEAVRGWVRTAAGLARARAR